MTTRLTAARPLAEALPVQPSVHPSGPSSGSSASALEVAQREITTLRAGLERRTLIGQAIGITMTLRGLSTDEALAHLVRVSQDTNVKVRDVAQVVVDEANRRAGSQAPLEAHG